MTYLRADQIIVLAKPFEQTLRAWGRTGPVSILGTAVEDAVLEAAQAARARDRVDGRPTLLFLARLEPKKGAATALGAHRLLRERGHDVGLVIAGDGPDAARLRQQTEEEGLLHVSFPGYVSGAAKAHLLARSDILLFPTEYGEGLPIAVLEAMAFGLPVVSRLVGGLPAVIVDGEAGFLTASTSAVDFADLVERLLGDPALCARIGAANVAAVAERFTGAAAAAQLVDVYGQTVSR
jgi:glycosyltransferase involved in cell wall biosynthesis